MDLPEIEVLVNHQTGIEIADKEYTYQEMAVRSPSGKLLSDNEWTRAIPGAKIVFRTITLTCGDWVEVSPEWAKEVATWTISR